MTGPHPVRARDRHLRRLSTPRAAALAGVAFAVLFGAVLVLLRLASSDDGTLRLATVLMPFAGIAFLWFIGVIRDGLGALEDKFFSSVFLGSGLLFLAMSFASAAVIRGVLAARDAAGGVASDDLHAFGLGMATTLGSTYALRMAAVFMMSLATIWLKTRLMPTPLIVVSYAAALAVLLAVDVSPWMTVTFPVWVLIVSLAILTRRAAAPTPDTA
ncbi:hypothetical protein [Mycolicibacterium grossiae]|uniref:DUF4386 domain-containing protein n=1 Tax=Mycolicibacterium grossiae TaxID=1552759 RepID=A0A1E8PVR0_9MYCO|nr:hypothetical protein [Mycolicibacterium grossiae]OFJ50398.1 hypothetical protein BEL07_28475 [Mycolicibacterium grossiae]QEM44905.1 hypothetical protein FZ046_09005 [Mycolicibacterium grossiae]